MRDHDEQMMSSSHDRDAEQVARSGEHEAGATAPHQPAAERSDLSRTWGGAGIPLTLALHGRDARRHADLRLLWGLPHGGDGFSLLPFERTQSGHTATISFNVPAHALPGVYAIQLQDGNEFLHRYQFVVTTQDPPETSPFRQLRTEPAVGTLRMYLTFDRFRDTPPRAAMEIAKLLKIYDTFYAPPPGDATFQEILDESLSQEEKREKFAKWLVKNQIAAEEAA